MTFPILCHFVFTTMRQKGYFDIAMQMLFSREVFRKHFSGFLWFAPSLVLGCIYDVRRLAERVRAPDTASGRVYEYHMTPITTFLGDTLPWLFWGGILLFLVQAIYQRKESKVWFGIKILAIPLWLFLNFLLFWHVD